LYVETATVGFHSFPHCETDDRVQLQFSAKLSVPHSFEVITPTLTRSVCRNCKLCLCVVLLWYKPSLFADSRFTRRNCCSPVTTYLKDSENDNYIILSAILITMWHCLIILQGKPTDYINFRVSKLIRVEQFRMIIWK
jgi:hypothetical protein